MSRTSEGRAGGRILGVDYGARYVGLAVSDALGITAQPLETLEVRSLQDAVDQVAEVAHDRGAELVVVGYPVLLSGREGELAKRVDRFISALAGRTGLPVEKWDERLTTTEASRVLREQRTGRPSRGHPRREGRREVRREGRRGPGSRAGRSAGRAVDRLAASLLLRSYLERHRRAEALREEDDEP